MLDYYLDNTLGLDETYVHDPSAVISSLHPEFFSFISLPLTVETEYIDRGRVIVDEKRLIERDKMVKVALDVDRKKIETFLSHFDKYL